MDNILQMIPTIGFPTVMCLLMWWDKKTTVDSNTAAINDIRLALTHVEAALNQNTEMISILAQTLNSLKGG